MSTSSRSIQQNVALPTFKPVRRGSRQDGIDNTSSKASSSRSEFGSSRVENQSNETRLASDGDQKPDVSPVATLEIPSHLAPAGRRVKRLSGAFLLNVSPSSRVSSIIRHKSLKGKENIHESTQSRLSGSPAIIDDDGSISPLPGNTPSSSKYGDNADESTQSWSRDKKRAFGTDSVRSQEPNSPLQVAAYGFDTDPTQIVDMALRLHDARRRQASAKRYVSATSYLSHNAVFHGTPEAPRTPERARQTTDQRANPEIIIQPYTSQDQDTEDLHEAMHISHATQNRVAKAKEYFELAYEHRRLLSHLPPVRQPQQRPSDTHLPDTKVYNPLQYARNRKLRFRERAAINSEGDGWHDVLKVRAWVDAVVNSHHAISHGPLECVRLPPLDLHEDNEATSSPDTTTAALQRTNANKPRRPKSDWVTHPGDLIADAFWTEQGLNKLKIYNRDNEPIYPPGTKFMFSGWRNRTPVHIPDELKSNPSSPETGHSARDSKQISTAPDLPVFESAHRPHGWQKTRSRFTHALKKGSRETARRDAKIFDTSSDSDSSSSPSDISSLTRLGRIKKRRQIQNDQEQMNLPNGDPFAPKIQTAERKHSSPARSVTSSRIDTRRQSHDTSNGSRPPVASELQTSSTRNPSQQPAERKRKFLTNLKLDSLDRGRSSFEYDSTAPATPADTGFPSIAINLSPPPSRSPSPGAKHKPSILGIVKDRVQSRKDRVDRTDFAHVDLALSHSKRGSLVRDKKGSIDGSRGTSPMTRGTSPFTKLQDTIRFEEPNSMSYEPRGSTISKVSTRTNESDKNRSSRVRGIFKGGRIAELVGNEVSRVGDYIWKRDVPRDEQESASTSGYESDSDELPEDNVVQRQADSPKTPLRAMRPSRTIGKSSTEQPKYHIQDLPSFTSPFQKDREALETKNLPQSPGGTPNNSNLQGYNEDPVSAAAAARRTGKSPRLDQMALPKLDMRAITPEMRRDSYGFGSALDLERTRSASDMFNDAINNRTIRNPKGRTGDTKIETGRRPSMMELYKTRSQTEPQSDRMVSAQELMRTRSLLLATTIKAGNITAYCEQYPQPQSSFLYAAFAATSTSGMEVDKQLPVKRKDEHTIAARHLIRHLQRQSDEFNGQLKAFAEESVQELHREVQILQDSADTDLFPRLQELSERAGQLAQKLTTTSTLAVKGVNDEVVEAMRLKRKGPYRFGRALGYKLMEWAVVSILWIIWFDVTIVRTVLGTVKAIWALISWLLFLR